MPEEPPIGLREANKALRSLPALVQDELQPVFDATAFQVARKAESLAPVLTKADPRRERGALRKAISWSSRPRSLSAVVRINSVIAFYWKFVEYGTIKMRAHPFFRPAADAMRSDHHARTMGALEKAKGRMERHETPRSTVVGGRLD